MRIEHMPLLRCPDCHNPLKLDSSTKGTDDRVEDGTLACTACTLTVPVVRHVPRFVPLRNYAAGFGVEWNKHARTQYDSYSGAPVSEQRFFDETGWDRALGGQRILEVGSGSGRFTEQAAGTGALVCSLDYSHAVDANYASNGARDNVLIVQGDLYNMPFMQESFDKIFCFGVLQHTPDVCGAFMSLPPFLKRGGSLVVDVYRREVGIRRLLATKYWIRPLTRRLPHERLYTWCRRYVTLMWPLTRLIHKVPHGAYINWRLLLADYRGMYALSEEMQREWAILDIFDKLAPAYDSPQSPETLSAWFQEAGLREIDVRYGHNGVQGRGIRP